MKLVLALGNPETKFNHTRHNVGFAMLDAFATENSASWQRKDKFKADVAELTIKGEKVILAKPTTYYNLVGESARAISDFYKIPPEHVLIIHDDHALPFGTVRTRVGGRDAGNNGVKSMNAHLGTNTARIRVGTWSDLRNHIDDVEFVLSKFSADEQKALKPLAPLVAALIESFAGGAFEQTTHRAA